MSENEVQTPKVEQKPSEDAGQSKRETPTPAGRIDVGKEQAPPDARAPHEHEKQRKGKPFSRFEIWTLVLGGFAILFAGGTGIAVYWQGKIAERAADIASQTLAVSQRPWLGIDGLPELDKADKGFWFVEVSVKNYGLSPALHSVLNIQSAATFYGDLAAMERIGCQMGDALTAGKLGARSGDAAQNGYTIFPNQPPLKFKEGIAKSDKNAIIYGCITYMDEFSKLGNRQAIIHHTPFCYLASVPFQVGKHAEECFAVAPAD